MIPVEVAAAKGVRFDEKGGATAAYEDARTTVTLGKGESKDVTIRCDFDPERVLMDPDALVLQLKEEERDGEAVIGDVRAIAMPGGGLEPGTRSGYPLRRPKSRPASMRAACDPERPRRGKPLQVLVGTIGCVVGHFPPERGVPEGVPTVSVAPAANAFGLSIDSPVTAFFSEKMREASITTGSGGSFNIYDRAVV